MIFDSIATFRKLYRIVFFLVLLTLFNIGYIIRTEAANTAIEIHVDEAVVEASNGLGVALVEAVKANEVSDKCSICLTEEDSCNIRTPCLHLFHKTCLEHWLKRQKSCPICRESVSSNQLLRIFSGAEIRNYLEQITDISADDAGQTLRDAAQNGHIEFVKLLIEKRTDISTRYAGWALWKAGLNGHTESVKLLIEKRTDISTRCAGLALQEAAQNGHAECVKLLIEKRTDISEDDAGEALQEAAQNGHAECVKLIFEKRTTDIFAFYAGWALQEAAQNGHAECVKLIADHMNEMKLIENVLC